MARPKKIVKDKPIVTTGTFPEVIMAVLEEDKKIVRVSWPKTEYGFMYNGVLKMHTKSQDFSWAISESDLLADDWIII